MKQVSSADEALKTEETYKGKPHGWVQWKGTNVCMDIHCECGELSHIDADFCYYVACPACERVYHVNGHVELIECVGDFKNEVIKECWIGENG